MSIRSPGSVLPLYLDAPDGGAAPLGALLGGIAGALALKRPCTGGRARNVRNLFGEPGEGEIYRGCADRAATHAMMERLAVHMMKVPWRFAQGPFNSCIPSGYTYLAQLAAHDLVSNVAPLPRPGDPASFFARDFRAGRLILDTIYGGGPLATPQPYAVAGNYYRQRYALRLGYGPLSENSADLANGPNTNRPARDIGRVACPYLTDPAGPAAACALAAAPRTDALLADPRNDDHVIISQLSALFHEFHNIVYAKLLANDGGVTDDFTAYRRFLEARKVVTVVYRRVIVEDLLRRLLEPGVYDRYKNASYPKDFLDGADDCRVPVEFSHAAYRFGHVMVRFSYTLNDKRKNGSSIETAAIEEILDRSSARRPTKLPLACTWLVDWSRFFDLGDEQSLNLSRRIAPDVGGGTLPGDSYFANEENRQGGLFLRDLIRGTDAGIRTVDSLIAKLPAAERARSRLLNEPAYREGEIRRWLGQGTNQFSNDELDSLSRDPPLFFFVLFEAAQCQNGERLGILASTILAEVFFAAYKKTRSELEDDGPELQPAFGDSVPADMPALIKFMKSAGGLQNINCTAP